TRLDDRLRGRDRVRVRLARHGQAPHRIDLPARPARHRRVSAGRGGDVRADQPRGRSHLHGARPAGGPRRTERLNCLALPPRLRPRATSPPRVWNAFRPRRPPVRALGVVAVRAGPPAAAPWIAPQTPYDLAQLSTLDNMLPPRSRRLDGMIYWLGTDDQGRDLLSAILYGLRLSLLVAAAATALGLAIGAAAGIVAAYVGGRIGAAIMRIVDIQLPFPTI